MATIDAESFAAFDRAFMPVLDNPSPALALSSFTGAAAAFAAISLARNVPAHAVPLILMVTPGLPEADRLTDDLEALAAAVGVRVLEFPPVLEGDVSATAARLKASAALGAYPTCPYPLVLVAPMPALFKAVPFARAVASATIRLTTGEAACDNPAFSGLQAKLLASGYERVGQVDAPGGFSVRGGVLDVWPPDAEKPVRAEFFGDELESLRSFDAATQISVGRIESVEITPVALADQGGGALPEATLLEIMPPGFTVVWLEHNAYPEELRELAAAARRFYTGDPPPRGVPSAPFQSSPIPGFAELGVQAVRRPELLDAARSRQEAYLRAASARGALTVEAPALSGGFEVPGLVVVTKSDRVFARRLAQGRRARAASAGERFTETLDLEPGELVVHLDYGIGKFLGSTEIEVGGTRSEVFTIEYANQAKVHVPTTHAHLLSRYVGVKGEKVKLHRIDGKRWVREKAEAQRSVQDLAASLLETQARRAVVPGFAYDLSVPGIEAFEAAFPWDTTPDQARAIEDVKRDLALAKPMDRLICGDAGYGKTEVAMRAAFVAAMNGRQVAMLVPTTVLAEQHYESFLARFEGTPVRIETLSRFQTPSAQAGTRARLLSGAADIVIGTHALLSKKVNFHDLGLIIIDEEQRFGVKHKEWLKNLRATADVLTLSATPIPRTLYLSMTGARDLSVLKTPPRERVAVETKIVRESGATIASAIRRELARGGQVYYLYNRVMTMDRVEAHLKALVPEARIDVAHGQMETATLAAKMQNFARGRTNVLLCTTIIESGLDIPRANTIIVDRADRFGMAELYQIRGRVGRSTRQGYAYFLLPEEGLVDSDARERLNALRKHAGLGVGFNIALRDLEIRGAGNLLGSEQSGHIAAVGFTLYCQLLQRTVARLRGETVPELVDVSISLDFLDFSPGSADPESGACLPYDYVEDEAQRMAFHRRLAEATTLKDVRRLKSELADRYGRLPRAAERLVKLAEFRVGCALAGISRLDVINGKAVFYRANSPKVAFVGRVGGSTVERKLAALFHLLAAHAPAAG